MLLAYIWWPHKLEFSTLLVTFYKKQYCLVGNPLSHFTLWVVSSVSTLSFSDGSLRFKEFKVSTKESKIWIKMYVDSLPSSSINHLLMFYFVTLSRGLTTGLNYLSVYSVIKIARPATTIKCYFLSFKLTRCVHLSPLIKLGWRKVLKTNALP